ncbi:MAG: hypothetical protein NWE92_12360 [Candidatus Bathyarchaeota archaeon]|nr:hypothetical protein [Candidatus Bathyarchaeota archaeon]
MATKIVIPIEEPTGLNSPIAERFGTAPYYAIVELSDNNEPINITTQENQSLKGTGNPQEAILDLCPDFIITYAMSLSALDAFKNAGVSVLKAEGTTAHQALINYREGKLDELVDGLPPTQTL